MVQPAPAPLIRDFQADELQSLRDDDDLQYQEAPPATNPLARWWQQLMRRLFRAIGTPDLVIFWKILFYTLAIIAVILIVMQLLGLDARDWLRGRGRRVDVPFALEADDVHETALPDRLRAAEEAGEWRLATRLGYLLVLKALTDRDLIDWKPDKTNHHYGNELRTSAPALTAAFSSLTWQFEYVWYGEFEPVAAQYEQVRTARQAFLTDLSNRRAA